MTSKEEALYLPKCQVWIRKDYLQFVELFKKANSTLEKQKQYKQAKDLWKIATNDQTLYEKKLTNES